MKTIPALAAFFLLSACAGSSERSIWVGDMESGVLGKENDATLCERYNNCNEQPVRSCELYGNCGE